MGQKFQIPKFQIPKYYVVVTFLDFGICPPFGICPHLEFGISYVWTLEFVLLWNLRSLVFSPVKGKPNGSAYIRFATHMNGLVVGFNNVFTDR